MKKKERISQFKLPHVFAILFCVLVVVAIMTYVLPAGQFARVPDEATGRNIIDPNSFTVVESTPVGILEVFASIPKGFEAAALIAILTFCISGTFSLITSSGLIPCLLQNISRKLSKRGIVVVPLLIFIFSLLDNFL